MKGGPQPADDRVNQVGENVLCVIELDAGEVAGVAGNIGDHEARTFRLGQHGYRPVGSFDEGTVPEQRSAVV
jgi:hypothetical protein